MILWLRCHVPMCVAFESVSVAGMRRVGGASWRQCTVVARGVHESFALIEHLVDPIYPADKMRLRRSPFWAVAAILWMLSCVPSFRTLLTTGIGECVALIDVMAGAAAKANLPSSAEKIEAMKPSPVARGRRWAL